MKLTKLNIQNFLGARAVEVELTAPVTLFSGENGAGKSSIQEAVRMALVGESVRVGLKKDYSALVSDGEKSAFAEVHTDQGICSISVPSGKGTHLNEIPALPYVLDAQRFASLEPNERRAFLFGLMGLSASGAIVKDRLTVRGCAEHRIEAIMPLLRSGFDAAHKEAQQRARDAKAEWRAITGETYGEVKAASWKADKPAFDVAALDDLRNTIAETEAALSAANQRLGAIESAHKNHADASGKLAGLRQKAEQYARIADKLSRDEAELKAWETKVTEARQAAGGGRKTGLVHELAYALDGVINDAQDISKASYAEALTVLDQYEAEHGKIKRDAPERNHEVAAKIPEYESALKMLQNCVSNGKRDLADADAAAKAITGMESALGTPVSEDDLIDARKHRDEIKGSLKAHADKMSGLQDAERKSAQADERTVKAQAAHADVAGWALIADALAPNGIPGEMLAEALTPLNERLTNSAAIAEWPDVVVTAEMQILAGGRQYSLLSESERWRVDAMLAEAVAHLTGLRLMVLDRFDVLDTEGRADLIAWMDELAACGEIDTALIFGTLKSLPAVLPETMSAWWIENGVVAQLKETA